MTLIGRILLFLYLNLVSDSKRFTEHYDDSVI